MKKSFKRISALLLALITCVCLCSCKEIKEMRENQAFYGENGEIIWGEQVYMPLEALELPEELECSWLGYGCVTEKDVPVLLSNTLGTGMYYNHSKTVIEARTYYARKDVYDYVANLVKYPRLNEYCVEVDYDGYYDIEYQLLKQRYLNAIDEIIYGGNEIYTDYEDYENYEEIATKDYADIYKCDEKMVFQSLIYRVEERENGDMLLTSYITQDIYDYDDFYYREYRIPDDKKAIMKELLTLGQDGLF